MKYHSSAEKWVFPGVWLLVGMAAIAMSIGFFKSLATVASMPTVEMDSASRECVKVLQSNGRRIPNGCEWLKSYERGGGRYDTVYIAPKHLREEAQESLPDVATRPH